MAVHARLGLEVVVDVGLYDRGVAADAARRLRGLDVLFVGVRCPIDVIMQRRADTPHAYAQTREPAERWERAVHPGWRYDFEVDTSVWSPDECAAAIAKRVRGGHTSAFAELGTFLA